jgi:small subunit ribosomal protein S2
MSNNSRNAKKEKSSQNSKSSNKKSKEVQEKKIDLPSLQKLLEAGAHFGHKSSRWNPEMEKYIFDTRAGIHIIDLAQTLELLYKAVAFLRKASEKGNILLVGTKGQAATLIKKTGENHGAFYISKRWPGGLMTNFKNVRRSVEKLMQLEEDLAARRGYETKKERLLMEREKDKLAGLYEGIRFMKDLPSVMVVVDTRVEKNAIREARKLGVKVVGLLDTNCDPSLIDYPVPANDDAIRSIELFVEVLVQGFTSSKYSAKLIKQRNDYADKLDQTRRAAKREEERLKREREREIRKLKAMKEGKEMETSTSSEGKVVRVVRKSEDTKKDEDEKETKKTQKKSESSKFGKAKKSQKAPKEKKEKKETSKESVRIEDLELGTRINNALEDEGIKTVSELKEYEGKLSEISGVGAVSVKKIKDALKDVK